MEHRKDQTFQFYAIAFSVWLCAAVLIINGCTPGTNHTWDSVMNKIRNKYPAVKQLSTDELQELLNNKKSIKPLIIDVRELEEYAISHLHGAFIAVNEDEALKIIAKECMSSNGFGQLGLIPKLHVSDLSLV
jgi:hypothetical protein